MLLVFENFTESKYGNFPLDPSKDLLFLGIIGQVLLTCEVTLGNMTVFAMLELLRSWKLGLVELSAVLSLLEQNGGRFRRRFYSNLFGMHPDNFF